MFSTWLSDLIWVKGESCSSILISTFINFPSLFYFRRKRPKPGQRTNVSVAVDNLPIFRIMAEKPHLCFFLRSMFICFNRFLCMIMNNNEFEANNHALKRNSTCLQTPFFYLLILTYTRKTLHKSSKIFVEHALLVPRILFQTQA